MPRYLPGLVAALLFQLPLAAQSPATPPDTGNVTLLDITVHPGEYEPHTVFLQKGIVYRASFSGQGIEIRVRSYGGRQLPFVVPLTNGVDASGASEFEIYPQSDGNIEFTEVFNAEKVPVTFRLWRDARGTERGRRSAEEGFWELGVDGLVGWYGNYGSQSGGSGATLGGCLSVRNGPGPLGWINGCIVGVERLTTGSGQGFFLFTEPEIRLSNGRRTDSGWKFEWGLLVRYAMFANGNDGGNIGGANLGYGAYVARDLRDLNGRGWRLTLMGRMDGSSSGSATFGSTGRIWAPVFQFGVGRYH